MFALAGNPTSRTNPADVKNIVRFAKCIISLFSINMSNEDNALCFVQNVCVCVCACVRVCVRACMRARVHACAYCAHSNTVNCSYHRKGVCSNKVIHSHVTKNYLIVAGGRSFLNIKHIIQIQPCTTVKIVHILQNDNFIRG